MAERRWKALVAVGLLAALALGCRGQGGSREGASLPIEITAEHPVPSPGAEELEEEPASASQPPR